MRICIRVDASPRLGLGHIRRCLSLAHALHEAGAELVFVSRRLGVDVAAQLEATPFTLHLLGDQGGPEVVPPLQDAAETLAALRTTAAVDWVIVDHYALDEAWHQHVAHVLTTRVAVIDDLADRPLAATLLIDHNLSADHRGKYSGRIDVGTAVLGGPRFALLGPQYARAERQPFNEQVRSIGIFLGGTDPDNVSVAALQACREVAGFTGPIEVVSTRANPNLPALMQACGRWPQTTLTLDLPDLATFFAHHDLQIGAGGGAMWERCCIGAPTLGLVCAENQRMVLPQLADIGAVALAPDLQPATLGRAVAVLADDPARRLSLARQSMTLVDGRGAQRVALHMLAPMLAVRPATAEDASRLYAWRSDPSTRRASHDSREIAYDSHCRWLDGVLADPDRSLWIGFVGRIPVGSIRFDRTGPGRFKVSLYLDPALHGLGLGAGLLGAGEQALGHLVQGPFAIDADVREHNAASRRLFLSAHYTGEGTAFSKQFRGSEMPYQPQPKVRSWS